MDTSRMERIYEVGLIMQNVAYGLFGLAGLGILSIASAFLLPKS
ncbi:MAG: hypothetical protein R3C03_08720 [Pirellulaceae bacterium]